MDRKRVVLDAGHGGRDPGAVHGGVVESNLTLDIVKRAGRILEQHGYGVAYTRTDDRFVPLEARVETIEDLCPDAFMSVHCNAIEDDPRTIVDERDRVKGTEIFYRDEGDMSLAYSVDRMLRRSGLWETHRGVFQDVARLNRHLAVLGNPHVPCILVEVGFLTNHRDLEVIVRNAAEIAELLAHGAIDFLTGRR